MENNRREFLGIKPAVGFATPVQPTMAQTAIGTLVIYSLCMAMAAPAVWSADIASLRGYSSGTARTEREWEAKFRGIPDPAALRAYMQRLAARPHHVGSPYDKENAEWIAAKAKEWGLDAQIEIFDVLFPTPKERALEMTEPTHVVAKIAEPAVAGDATSAQQNEQLPVYNAYSIDGDVTAPLVYVNYGIPADYEELDRMGISVKGAIVIARYGGSWRGIKPKVAGEHGAVGCLIYSDPRDDGYAQGDTFPNGPFRPSDGAQRGSVMDMPVYPGDPLTPGVGATKDAKRLPLSEVKTLTTIPVMPISYGDAQPMLAALKGPMAPAAWRGALPITYHVGPGPAKIHLKLKFNWDTKPLYNVIVRIPGSQFPDEWIIRGNHHDAWVNGAEDPVSGTGPLMEEMRALGTLLKQGWKPKRTIIYCAWDGEEPGLLGSTEWAETHAAELQRKAAVYINSDGNGRGFLRAVGSHTLEKFINGVARDIDDPESKVSVWRRLQAERLARAAEGAATDRQEARTRADLRIGALGSGSDYTAFLDHLGIASIDLGFGGEDEGGIYHSIYDDFYWYTHFSDKDFVYGRALAQTAGTAVMRLADADLLPLDFDNFTDTLRRYIDEVQKLARDKRDQIVERNRQIDDGVFAMIDDPRNPRTAPARETVPPFLNFAPLENGFAALQRTAKAYDEALAHASENGGDGLARASLREVNARLIAIERAMTLNEGLPNRDWFKHQIYAPGFYTGYGVKTLPAVRESIEQKDWKLAEEQIVRVGKVLENTGEAIQGATAELTRAAQ
jgi:N-acetylated-alpha-linked acidic dipeptidase